MTLHDDPPPFDLGGPLPGPGVTVLEASAGTGKTFTIAALVTRMVAEGHVPLSRILAVTFTRMATSELRDRVRRSLVRAERALRLVAAGAGDGGAGDGGAGGEIANADGTPPGQRVLAMLTDGTREEVRQRQVRLSEALANFDSATITTTHGFCQLVLGSLGVAGEVAEGAGFLEDPGDLVREVVDDLYVAEAHRQSPLPFTHRQALEIARCAVSHPATPLVPLPEGTAAAERGRFAQAARTELARRLVDANLLTYEELLSRLAKTLADPHRGPAACARLQERYRVVLVDEFQDTDPVQWQVVRRAFATGPTTLVLIGDPKQAIYAFRGADVYAYLEAVRLARQTGGHRYTLNENWRCDQALLDAFDALLSPVNLGHPEIPYRKVVSARPLSQPGISGAPGTAPMRVRVVHARDHDELRRAIAKGSDGDIRKAVALNWVASDLADDVAGLLGSGAQLARAQGRPLRPGDVAVLVRTNEQARLVQKALRAAAVPAVLAGADTVFSGGRHTPSPAAVAWLRLLDALEQPASRPRAAAVALGPFIGMTAKEVAGATESTWEGVHARLQEWAGVLRRYGVAALYKAASAGGLAGRTLRWEGGERELTDLGHLAEVLHAEGSTNQEGASGLRTWLARRIEEAAENDVGADEHSRRLESDAEAVQVLTVHRVKGLEFPVVYCPYLWDSGGQPNKGGPVVFHGAGGAALDPGRAEGNPGYEQHRDAERRDERGEDLRQLYVALTRARHQVVIWWVRTKGGRDSPLGRLIMFRDEAGNVPPEGNYTPKDEAVHARLASLARRAPGRIVVERAGSPLGRTWVAPSGTASPTLRVATFNRGLDMRWRRTSYSAVTSAYHAQPVPLVGSEPEESGTSDEPAQPDGAELLAPGSSDDWLRTVACPLGAIPAGREVGTFLHRVLERTDFAAADLRLELTRATVAAGSQPWVKADQAAALVEGLHAAICTPLGPLAPGLRLRDINRADRLDELAFELPLAGGDQPVGEVLMADLAQLWADHLGTGNDGFGGYSERLADPRLSTGLRGYLTGSLDMVFRSTAGTGARFFLVDYKTNRLAGRDEPLAAWHYRPDALQAEMSRAHYPLQALFYLVALHRYLRWRLPGYRPEVNLGGVLYLFVRGMLGEVTPLLVNGQPCGVFSWWAPTDLVLRLSDLLGAGSPARRGGP
jgi:exodeoxyribonuclease V beta subunit